MNAFWEDRRPALEKVKVPAYVVGSYANAVHVPGTFRAWEGISSEEKWFRIHDELEWTDYYNPVSTEDLRKFFDHYLKGVNNGWENTPKIRASILDPGGKNVTGLSLGSFPPVDAVRTKWYLDAAQGKLSGAAAEASEISYISDNGKDSVFFDTEFEHDEALFGYGDLKLWVEAQDADDTDVYVKVEKIGTNGKPQISHVVRPDKKALELLYKIIPMNALHYGGPSARLRASLRHVDEEKTTEREIYHTFDRVEKLEKGVAVPLQLNLGPVGMMFHKGERLRLTIGGYDLNGASMPGIKTAASGNKGKVVIRTGGEYDSFLRFHVVDSYPTIPSRTVVI